MKKWWAVNVVWLVIFIGGLIHLLNRAVDGSGEEQTLGLRMISIAILAVLFFFVLFIQMSWRHSIKKKTWRKLNHK
ncbi:DUF3923 family protein [Enterococcus crotali]|uniref:DUF3923 family protein n=1 Tax=Enterococcus crotali TaxID=1453587 RepID=UPI0004712FA1|nr:DUF3923 family protein [Enterococcus crotali]OTP48008.1 hypothetical protein A5881_003130 [Enterococcus termitis]